MKAPVLLSVAHHRRIGGAERSLLLLLRGLRERGWECRVLVPGPGPLSDGLRDEGFGCEVAPFHPVYAGGSRTSALLRLIRAGLEAPWVHRHFRAIAGRVAPSVVHVNGLPSRPAVAFKRMGLPVAWHVRELYHGLAGRALRRAAASHSDVLACISSACRAQFSGAPDSRARIVPNGVTVPRSLRPTPGNTIPRIVLFSQLIPEKGHDLFLRALARLVQWSPAVRVEIFGEDPAPGQPWLQRLRRLIRRLGLEGLVELRGFVADPERELAGAEILVLASREEPSGRVLLEAMAHGVPVVAAAAGGVPEIVRDGETGLLFAPGDEAGCAECLRRLLTEETLAQRLRACAYELVRASFSAEAHVAVMHDLLSGLARGSEVPGSGAGNGGLTVPLQPPVQHDQRK
jgi:glycosyltransferase involved in cell wall biosynthesis